MRPQGVAVSSRCRDACPQRAALRGPPKYNKKPWRAIETRLFDRASRQGGNTPRCDAVAVVPEANGAPSDEDLLESQLQALRDRTSAHHAGQSTTGTADAKIVIDRDPGLDMQVEEEPDASGATPTTGAGDATRVNGVPTLSELSAARPAPQLGAAQERLQRKVAVRPPCSLLPALQMTARTVHV